MTTSEWWLSPSDAGALLGVGPDRVSQLVREGVLKASYTPGGHIRIRRDQVEELLADPPSPSPTASAPQPQSPPVTPAEHRRPAWEDVPPWNQRVHQAEAELEVMKLDGERERLMESREAREVARQRATVEQAARVAEGERLRGLKAHAIRYVPVTAPVEVRAEVARGLERAVTSERFPAALAGEHVESLLKAEVGRLLRPWRAREARREQARRDAAEQERVIGWEVFSAGLRVPRDWDSETRREFERELRAVLRDEFEPGMDQDEADAIAQDLLDEWLEEGE